MLVAIFPNGVWASVRPKYIKRSSLEGLLVDIVLRSSVTTFHQGCFCLKGENVISVCKSDVQNSAWPWSTRFGCNMPEVEMGASLLSTKHSTQMTFFLIIYRPLSFFLSHVNVGSQFIHCQCYYNSKLLSQWECPGVRTTYCMSVSSSNTIQLFPSLEKNRFVNSK